MKNKFLIISGVILMVALIIRMYGLGSIPYGFHVDEVKAGWNAWSILQTGYDDKGNFLPKYYDSFGDFRPTGLIYLIIPSLLIFGKTIFAVRFPFALLGALSIFPLYFLTWEVSKNKKISLWAMVLLALNPWHVVISRSTSESVVALFLTLWGLYFFVKLFAFKKFVNALLSFIFFVGAFGFYHNIRVLAPVFLLILIMGSKFILNKKIVGYQLLVFGLLLVISIAIFVSPESRGRMSQVSIKSDFQVLYETQKMPTEETPGHLLEARVFHNKLSAYIRRFAEEYKDYFGTNFLVGSSPKPIRYTTPQIGLLTYVELVLAVMGLFWMSKRSELILVLLLLMASPLPAAVTIEDVPNMQRAVFMVPFLVMMGAYGIEGFRNHFRSQKTWTIVLLFLYLVNFVYFVHMYFTHQKTSIAAYYRDGGNMELISKLNEVGNSYEKVILTNSPDDLYSWVAFGLYKDAKQFNLSYRQTQQVDNFVFSKDKCPVQKMLDDKQVPNPKYLYVDAEGCLISGASTKYAVKEVAVIRRPDGSPPYYLRTVSYK